MGSCMSSPSPEASAAARGEKASAAIDRQIEDDARRLKKECKILLLGSGESGKTTIVKQMKIIHQSGYSEEERLMFRPTIHKNVLDGAKALCEALAKLSMAPAEEESALAADRILPYMFQTETALTAPMDPQLVADIKQLWHDAKIPELLARQNEYYLMDSAPYFFEELDRIADVNYIPSEMDVLRARTKTTGIYETRFSMGNLSIHMFDVGGQRSERKKWIHCFEAVTSIIFCVALSEYDQVLLEESNQNRMTESLVLFDSVINSRWFVRTSIILFLNKIDIFKAKLPKSPLGDFFPDYQGGSDANKAAKYILYRFTQVNRAKLNIYPHLTQATDTSNIRLVFAAVKETILQNALKDSGIL
ncbi:Guanine nucleotide-binding protein alpha-2 subunit [Savitreella phatthalungensis]